MIITREIEIEIKHDEVDEIMFEACPFDKLCLIIRLSKTIKEKEIAEIRKYLGDEILKDNMSPVRDLLKMVGE